MDARTNQESEVGHHTELAILGAMLLEQSAVIEAVSLLDMEDFSLDSHQKIFRMMGEMSKSGSHVDYVTLSEALRKKGQLESIGGLVYLLHLTEGLPRNFNVAPYAKIVKDKSTLRQIASAAEVAQIRASQGDEEASEVLRDVQERISEISAGTARDQVKSFVQIGPDVLETMRERSVATDEAVVMGYTTTLPDLDRITMGLQKKEMSVWGGYQSDGKTSIALQIVGANAKQGVGCLIFSHESTESSVFKRITSQQSGIAFKFFKDPRLLQNQMLFDDVGTDWKAVERCCRIVENYPIWVVSGRMTVEKITSITRMMKDRFDIGITVIDFIQKVKTNGKDMRSKVTNASEDIRSLAMETDMHAMILSQFNMPDKRIKAPPTLWSFRESQGPADDGHLACGLYRPLAEDGSFVGLDKIYILKNREGEMNINIDVAYNTKTMMYEPKRLPDYNQSYVPYGEKR